jgi:hypothetical protein
MRNTRPRVPDAGAGRSVRRHPAMTYNSLIRASQRTRGARAMTDYLIAAILFVAIITTLVYLWKREHP